MVAGSVATTAKFNVPTALKHAIEDCLSEVRIMQDDAPGGKWLVRSEDDGLALKIALIDPLEEHFGGVVRETGIADLIDHEHVRMCVRMERVSQAAGACCVGQFFDERGGSGETGLKTVLDGAIRDRDGESGFSSSGRAGRMRL